MSRMHALQRNLYCGVSTIIEAVCGTAIIYSGWNLIAIFEPLLTFSWSSGTKM